MYQVIDGIPVWGVADPEVIQQMSNAKVNGGIGADYACIMADSHLGYSVPVGGVIAFSQHICVNGVGYDIACGNKCVRLDGVTAEEVKANMYRNMNEVQKHISFGIGRKNNERVDHELFSDPIWNDINLLRDLRPKAMDQLGTVGSGNHYVDIFCDQLDRVWIGVHFGSRGLGHTIATHYVKAGGGKDGVHAAPVLLHESSDLGQEYLRCMELAGRYAYAGRDWVCERVAKILRGTIVEEVHNHHNYCWRERHFDKDLWVVRKGATPCFPYQRGFIGGSMGDLSYIIEGTDSVESAKSLFSTIHGAGRAMGRTEAKGKRDKRGNTIREGKVTKEAHEAYMNFYHPEVRGGDLDESPLAYKRINTVLHAHNQTTRIIHKLTPIGVCMADARNYDPYKD